MEFAQGGWAHEVDPTFGVNAGVLAGIQGRFKIAGDQVTFLSGWQEGAILSAWEAIKAIDRHANPTANR
jgi:monoamine oxidase